MRQTVNRLIETDRLEGSAPCRIDMGGTLDIPTFFFPLRHLLPCTFNIALDLRTRVCVHPYRSGIVRISSRGFQGAEYELEEAPFDHPLGLLFAIAAYFGISGVHIDVTSSSPPRSALGGSSAAGVALVAAFAGVIEKAGGRSMSGTQVALVAQAIESSVAGVPCGLQDQLAAVFGGVNVWHWPAGIEDPAFKREPLFNADYYSALQRRLLVAYCGMPHESKDINGRWAAQFLSGKHRKVWPEILGLTKRFISALKRKEFDEAAESMNRETVLRREMTPDVLDEMGEKLFTAAMAGGCGARFTGAGGGGCLWALGRRDSIEKLQGVWERILKKHPDACLLNAKIDVSGVMSSL